MKISFFCNFTFIDSSKYIINLNNYNLDIRWNQPKIFYLAILVQNLGRREILIILVNAASHS